MSSYPRLAADAGRIVANRDVPVGELKMALFDVPESYSADPTMFLAASAHRSRLEAATCRDQPRRPDADGANTAAQIDPGPRHNGARPRKTPHRLRSFSTIRINGS